ncbi:MAG TPA: histidine kinase dimerization/phospho-acceptor domain-containing protein [Phycisphaerae bacterium]|nr:HAMP domain-containing protein [Phycisphaerales bacterium]HRX86029.1 histidine kinase dimerization/phospho-acceptor domain-containing protein [Phycisphaerae bacterium]
MMSRRFSTLRLRLTLSYMLVFGLIQAAVCLVILAHREHNDSGALDARLVDQARAVGQIAELANGGSGAPLTAEDIDAIAAAIDDQAVYYEIRLADGTSLARSPELQRVGLDFPLPDVETLRRARDMYSNLSSATVDRLLGDHDSLRLLSHYHVPAMGLPVIVQLGANLAELHVAQHKRQQMFLAISLIALIPAGLTTWLLAKRSLRPLAQVADQVNVISPRELNQRIRLDNSPEELARLTETVNEMLERLHKAFRAQDQFLTNAAHELKTPLSILLGQAQVLGRKARTPEEYEHYLRETEGEMRRLAKTIDGLLMLARAHTRDPDLHAISANDFVTEAVERCQPLAREAHVRLALNLAVGEQGDTEPIVQGDPRLLATMVENLVRNALRMSRADDTVAVDVDICAQDVCVAVRDRGPALIAAPQIDPVHQYTRREFASHVTGDTGIGLLIVQSVIQMHGGTAKAGNRTDGGAEFVVRLPLSDADSSSIRTALS